MRALGDDEESTPRLSWLLEHAEQTMSRTSEADLTRTAHPRRAVSAAYYAAFHHVVIETAHSACPAAGREVWAQMCRGFTHEGVSRVCGWLTGNPSPTSVALLVGAARRSPGLVESSKSLVRLRNERELADYSHEIIVDRPSALTVIDEARSAVGRLEPGGHADPSWQAFVALMLMESKPRTYALPATPRTAGG